MQTISGIPTAIIKYKVSNPTNKPIDVSVVGTMANVVGFDGYDVFNNVKLVDQVENEYREEAGLKGWYYKAKKSYRERYEIWFHVNCNYK